MMNQSDEIGLQFLKRRKELGLTQEQLGEKVGMTQSEISDIEDGDSITSATIHKLADALELSVQLTRKSTVSFSRDVIHYIVMGMGMFARQHKLTRREACNYLARYKGLEFSINNYEAEHQLSLQDCVDDMTAICQRNGGGIS